MLCKVVYSVFVDLDYQNKNSFTIFTELSPISSKINNL